jgi:hypothetical protein
VEEGSPGVGPVGERPVDQSSGAEDRPAVEGQPVVEDRRTGEERPAAG